MRLHHFYEKISCFATLTTTIYKIVIKSKEKFDPKREREKLEARRRCR